MKAYWFSDNGVAQHGDRVPFVVRPETYRVDGEIVPCRNGLHASQHPLDALSYAGGNTLDLVELSGVIVAEGDDKHAASERRHIARIDAEPLLREFSRWCALRVAHLWDCPPVVRQYLETGDESLRAAARAAAASDAARAAREAAWAASDAAWAAAREAARAAREAAVAAVAARAARAAGEAAVAAGDAGDAAWAAQRAKLQELVDAAFAAKENGHD